MWILRLKAAAMYVPTYVCMPTALAANDYENPLAQWLQLCEISSRNQPHSLDQKGSHVI